MSYLYGAAVQGIQQFIFQTNKLSEIIGASELVERICTTYFEKVLGKELNDNPKAIVNAAGNVKYIFDDREDCERMVREFPQYVQTRVPGVTISQAVIEYDDEQEFREQVIELEGKLRTQRNRPVRPTELGLMGIQRSGTTGVAAVSRSQMKDKVSYRDEATEKKLSIQNDTNLRLIGKAFGDDVRIGNITFDTEDMTGENSWIAIIHADGNGLGQVVQGFKDKKPFKKFSSDLDNANTRAAQRAYHAIAAQYGLGAEIPIRPVVLSGDDFTMICRAEFAFEYAKAFIEAFEDETEKMGYPLTACAGIAFMKSAFPFYYGYEMAEALCAAAKKDAKTSATTQQAAPSCILFYKIEDSFTESYEDIRARVLTTKAAPELSYAFGPYYIREGKADRWTAEELLSQVRKLGREEKDANAVKTHIRRWLGIRFNDAGKAEQKLNRTKKILEGMSSQIDELTTPISGRVPAYDVLTLHTIQTQETK